MENRKFTRDELMAMKAVEVKEVLVSLGGDPKGLLKDKAVNAILQLQASVATTEPAPAAKKRGRPKKAVNAPVEGVEAVAEKAAPAEEGAPSAPTKRTFVPVGKRTEKTRQPDPDKKQEPGELSDEVLSILSSGQTEEREGILEIHPEGYGFARAVNFESGPKDSYISSTQIKRFGLRRGDLISGLAKKSNDPKPAPMLVITRVNGLASEPVVERPAFESLVPVHPNERYRLESVGAKNDVAIRAIDLVSPIGKGQRGIIVSPPKAGKTTLLKKIANSISQNYPDTQLFILLVDERPEEVTDMQRSTKGTVVYSTFDEQPEHHIRAAELLMAHAKRLVEIGKNVVILLDSLTRLARAYNLTVPPSGRTLSGGMDPSALYGPKRFFGAARNIENGGSLTIIATALVETNSRLDEVIFEEFKGTGNMEIHLDRRLSEKRIFPAISLNRSSTRREELLLTPEEGEAVWTMRRMFGAGDAKEGEATESLLELISRTTTNDEFVKNLKAKRAVMEKSGYKPL